MEQNALSTLKYKQKCTNLLTQVRQITGQKAPPAEGEIDQENKKNSNSLKIDSKLLRDIHSEQNREMNKLKKMMSEINSPDEQQRGFREILEKFVDNNMSDGTYQFDLSSFEVVKKQVLYFLDKFHSLVCSYYNSYEMCNNDKTLILTTFPKLDQIFNDLKHIWGQMTEFGDSAKTRITAPLSNQLAARLTNNHN